MKKHTRTRRLFNLLILFTLLASTVFGSVVPFKLQAARAANPSMEIAAVTATNWCAAGSFNGWDNTSHPFNDAGNNGDLFANDGIFSLSIIIATAGHYEWKAVECGNWGNSFPTSGNSWFITSAPNQSVRLTFDTNDHSSDAGVTLLPTQNIVHAWDDVPTSLTAVGDWQTSPWNNADSSTLMTPMGNGFYHLAYTIPAAGTYIGKVVATGSWGEQYAANGRSSDGANIQFTTVANNQVVVFLVDTHQSRLTITPQASGSGNWCVAGDFNGWNNASHPLYDDGTNGDLLGGDGVFSYDFTVATAGRAEWKVVECGNWGLSYPSDNAWLLTSAPNQVVKLTFDTNDHTYDAGLKLIPTQNIVNAWDSLPASFTAVGPWQGWDPSNGLTTMTALGSQYFLLNYAIATPGTYAAKLTNTGGWDYQYGADGRHKNAPTINFTTYSANDVAQFWLDGNQGRWAIVTPPEGGAAHDNNIWWDDLGHNSRDGLYRTPFGAVVTGTEVTLRLRAAENDLTGVKVRLYNDRTNVEMLADMSRVASDGTYEFWAYTFDVGSDPTIYWYRFIALDGTATAYYEDDNARTGGWGQPFSSSPDNSWQLTVYDPAFQTPDWIKNAVVYQVFADRFRDGDSTNNPAEGSFFYDDPRGTLFRSNATDWNTPICDPRDNTDPDCTETYSQNFYGGDLQGLIDKLDYLETLGVTAIYLNPIFEAPSNHKYDTTDFGVIDDNFGDLALFQELVTEAGNRGIQLILDGVFNHTSSDSIYFDRYGRYAQVGACESHTSPYRDWYYFTDVTPGTGPCVGSTGIANAANYESWWGYDSLPKLRATSQPVRDLIWADGTNSIGPYWIDQGASGWRLDVAADVDPGVTNDPTNDYWEGFRAAVRAVNAETYIVGEEWGNGSPWLLGDEWDAVMNYQYSSAILSFFRDTPFVDNDHNSGSSAGVLDPINPTQLDERLLNWIERYPPEALYAMMNLLGSHDTNRPLFMLDHDAATGTDDSLLLDPDYDWSDAIERLKGVAILQMTLPGAPTIYYGDEVGAIGPVTYANGKWEDDPYNRVPYPWLDEAGTPFYTFLQSQSNQDNLYNYYKLLADTRHANAALRTGSFDPLLKDDTNGIYAYGRKLADHSSVAVVVMNRSAVSQTVALDVDGYLPYGADLINVLDSATYTVNASGLLEVDVPERSGAILIPTGPLDVPPAAVSDLTVTDENNAELELAWSPASGADSYDVYRSLLSGGGYTFVGNTANTTYTDSGLTNAIAYYYVVVSRNDTNGLVSGNSNEASGTPQHDLSSAWYNLQWPHEFTHTISAITVTQNIYGQLWIDNFTGGNGPAEGIRAQVGYGPTGSQPDTWQWVEMSYDQAVVNNDEYIGALLPDAIGNYHYATRWSSDNGLTWYFSDLSGPGDNGSYGLMHVVASSDATAPAAPQNLAVSGTTASSISLEWDANTEPDLAGYDIYRQVNPAGGFSKIARLFGSPTHYTDTGVVTNETYDYYIFAFDTSFNFSAASNTVTATAEPRVVAVTFEVTVPAGTPGTIYLAGSIPGLPSWNPGATPMNQIDDVTWSLTLNILDGASLEYKYTRGSWDMVEKQADGNAEINNRAATVSFGTNGTQRITDTVANWRDPFVFMVDPADGVDGVPITTTVSLTWNQAMPADSEFVVSGPGGVVNGTFSYDSTTYTVIFTPADALPEGLYTVSASGKQDAGGDTQQVPFASTFQVGTTYWIYLPLIFKP